MGTGYEPTGQDAPAPRGITTDMLAALAEPFAPERVSWRVGSTNAKNAGNDPAKLRGQALAYIDARDVQDRLDAVCGPSNWQNRFPLSDGKRVICEIGIRIDGEWVWKSDGAGDTDYEGEKGAISDAFKRAAVKWGVGRYLYDVDAPWVSIEAFGRSFKIVDSEKRRLLNVLPRPAGQAKTQAADNRAQTKSEPANRPFDTGAFVARDAEDWAAKFATKLEQAPSLEALNAFVDNNAVDLGSLKAAIPEKAARLITAIAARQHFLGQAPSQAAE